MVRFITVLLLSFFLATPAMATGVHFHWFHLKPPVAKVVPSGPSASQKFFCVVNPGGFFVCAVLVGIIVHELMGPACAKPGNRNGYDTPTFWRPLCNWKRS